MVSLPIRGFLLSTLRRVPDYKSIHFLYQRRGQVPPRSCVQRKRERPPGGLLPVWSGSVPGRYISLLNKRCVLLRFLNFSINLCRVSSRFCVNARQCKSASVAPIRSDSKRIRAYNPLRLTLRKTALLAGKVSHRRFSGQSLSLTN